MEKKKVHIVVRDGRVESVLSKDEIEVEVIDFDCEDDTWPLQDYVDTLRSNMHEVVC